MKVSIYCFVVSIIFFAKAQIFALSSVPESCPYTLEGKVISISEKKIDQKGKTSEEINRAKLFQKVKVTFQVTLLGQDIKGLVHDNKVSFSVLKNGDESFKVGKTYKVNISQDFYPCSFDEKKEESL